MEPLEKLVARAEMPASRRQIRHSISLACAILVLALSVPFTATRLASAEVHKTVESILSDNEYQREIPRAAQAQKLRLKFELPEWMKPGPLTKTLIWIIAAVIVFLAVAYIIGRVTRAPWLTKIMRLEDTPAETGASRTTLSEFGVHSTFEEVERLAHSGQFGEAVHLLLLLCFDVLRKNSPTARDAALTSREVLERARLPASTRTKLAFIVSVVEIGHFGGQNVDRSDYDQCLDGYRDIVAMDTL